MRTPPYYVIHGDSCVSMNASAADIELLFTIQQANVVASQKDGYGN